MIIDVATLLGQEQVQADPVRHLTADGVRDIDG